MQPNSACGRVETRSRIVLGYAGGFDVSLAIPWLARTYHAEIITATLDMGRGRELEAVRDRALAAGAVRAHVLDVRDEFATDYVLRALQAGALCEDRDPMATALGRPLIARKLVEIAGIEKAAAVAHGATSEDEDHVRIGVAVRALDPKIKIITPAQEWGVGDSPYRIDTNLWGRSIECGILEDPWAEPPEDIYSLTRSPAECPDEPAYVELTFERGVPTAVNGVAMPLVELIGSLDVIAGSHGVGRVDRLENPPPGSQLREIHEAPAALVLHAAHRELQSMVTTKDAERFSRLVSLHYADIVYNGSWFTPLREALDAYVGKMQERATGVIRLKLFKGDCRIVGRKSSFAASRKHDNAPLVGTI